jgi:hypothetical protein
MCEPAMMLRSPDGVGTTLAALRTRLAALPTSELTHTGSAAPPSSLPALRLRPSTAFKGNSA